MSEAFYRLQPTPFLPIPDYAQVTISLYVWIEACRLRADKNIFCSNASLLIACMHACMHACMRACTHTVSYQNYPPQHLLLVRPMSTMSQAVIMRNLEVLETTLKTIGQHGRNVSSSCYRSTRWLKAILQPPQKQSTNQVIIVSGRFLFV